MLKKGISGGKKCKILNYKFTHLKYDVHSVNLTAFCITVETTCQHTHTHTQCVECNENVQRCVVVKVSLN